jgi:FKBP-type peptidyl-prolyl cis-trans isomerase 2
MQKMIARAGDRVRVQFTPMRNERGRARDAATPKVMEFTVGEVHALPGLSRFVLGMRPGERKCITLQPKDAFGEVQARLIREIPRSCFRTKTSVHRGMILNVKSTGQTQRGRRVRVIELRTDSIIVDGNHPRAGRTVELSLYLTSVDSSPEANRSRPQFDCGGEA